MDGAPFLFHISGEEEEHAERSNSKGYRAEKRIFW